MASASFRPASVRAVHGAGFLSLIGWVAWVSARFEDRPLWPVSLREVAGILLWAAGLHAVLRTVEALARTRQAASWGDYARAYALMLFCGGTFLWYFNAHLVGPLDAQWYENMTTDSLTQARSGTFPVVVGSTVYAFNGAVHPLRSAPWQFVLADGVDILSGRTLAPVAVEHITAIASFCAAVLILYVGFARSRPGAGGLAWLFALCYAMAPAATVPFFQFDMYMTLTAQPLMVAAFLCVQRILEEDSIAASGWLGVFLAALWYCHPPMALITGLIAGACAAAGVAIRGATPLRLFGAALGMALFALLAAPYFRSMSELAQSETDPLACVGMPALGLGLSLFAAAGFLRTRSLPWLALLPTAFLCLRDFEPSLVPFAGFFVAAMLVAAWVTRSRSRQFDAAWVAACALVASLLAVTAFPNVSVPGGLASWTPSDWRHLIDPMGASGTLNQPGYLLWFLMAAMAATIFGSRSLFVQCSAAAALVLAIAFGIFGELSAFLWRNTPADIIGVIATAYDLRLLPAVAVVGIVGGFYWLTALRADYPEWGRILLFPITVLVAWTLWEHAVVLYDIRKFRITTEETANRNRSENVALERYSWDLLAPPRFINWGVMDPALETRFWSDADRDKALIDPDQIERSLEGPGQRPIRVSATPIPTGRDWLTLDPTIELDPGQHVLLRFDFLGRHPSGYLVVRGQTIHREYQLPASGRDYAFGFNPGNTHTLSLWNSGATHESVQLLIDRSGPHAWDPPGPDPYWLMYQTPFDPKRSPIELYSLTPLRLRVDAPTAGYVETFRSLIPGYKVYLDGKPVTVHASRNALVSVRVPPGTHELWVRFAGTVRLHTAIRWAMTAWLMAAAAAVVQLRAMARQPHRGRDESFGCP